MKMKMVPDQNNPLINWVAEFRPISHPKAVTPRPTTRARIIALMMIRKAVFICSNAFSVNPLQAGSIRAPLQRFKGAEAQQRPGYIPAPRKLNHAQRCRGGDDDDQDILERDACK